jgi:hypothetical protein
LQVPAATASEQQPQSDDSEYKKQADAVSKAAAALKGARTAHEVAKAAAAAIETAQALLQGIDRAQLHQDIALHSYSAKVGDSLDTSPEWRARDRALSSSQAAVVAALSLKACALMDQLSDGVDASAVPLRLCMRPTSTAGSEAATIHTADEREVAFGARGGFRLVFILAGIYVYMTRVLWSQTYEEATLRGSRLLARAL